ncbi:MAG: efflux RND transporter periplasmic adaptor subunit [Desulfobulbus sp.]|jgi:membrane fusion protein (multidrug efflux system)
MKQCIRTSFVLACMVVGGLLATGCREKGDDQAMMAQKGPVEVEIVTIRPQPVDMIVELTGRTAAYRTAEVRPQVGGIIKKRLFTEGVEVKAGQVLYQIDPATYQAAVDSASAALARAEALEHSARLKAKRYQVLVQTKAVSSQEQVEMEAAWKEAQANVRAAKAALDAARINLNYTRVTAPISGRIGRSFVTEGALVTGHQPGLLATIQQLEPIYVDVNQSSDELVALKRDIAAGRATSGKDGGIGVNVLWQDGTPYPHTGSLEFSEVTVDPGTGTVTLRAIMPNPERELLPGMFVRARIEKGRMLEAVVAPARGISRDQRAQSVVLVVNKDSVLENRVVEVGQTLGDKVWITEGLNLGERIVVSGLQKAKAGDKVSVVDVTDTLNAPTPPSSEPSAASAPPADKKEA